MALFSRKQNNIRRRKKRSGAVVHTPKRHPAYEPSDTQEFDTADIEEAAEMRATARKVFRSASADDNGIYDTSFSDNDETIAVDNDNGAGEAPENRSRKKKKKKKIFATPFGRSHQPRMRVIRSSQSGCFGWLFGFVGLIVRILIVTVLVIVTCSWIGWQIASSYIDTKEVPVPNIRGLQIETALSIASEHGMSIFKERNEPSSLVAHGEIIDQKPIPGTRARQGASIRVVIAGESEDRQKYPDVTGMTQEEAISLLKGANLKIGNVTFLEDSSRPKNTVITQTPEAASLIKSESTPVDLLISK